MKECTERHGGNDNKSIKISVVIPVYNTEEFLHKCLNSVLSQTYKNIEVILVNGVSKDNSLQICRKYAAADDRMICMMQGKTGLSDARNCGIESATGEYIMFIDSDDYVENTYVESMINQALADKSDIVISDGIIETGNGIVGYKNTYLCGEQKKLESKEAIKVLLGNHIYGSPWTAWGKLFKLSLFKDIRFPVGHISEDLAVMPCLLCEAAYISYIPQRYYHYVIRDGSLSNSNSSRSLDENYFYEKRMAGLVKEHFPDIEDDINVNLAWTCFLLLNDKRCRESKYYKDILADMNLNAISFWKSNRRFKYKILLFWTLLYHGTIVNIIRKKDD